MIKTHNILIALLLLICGCTSSNNQSFIQDVTGTHQVDPNQVWLTHEHVLVDFIGADNIRPDRYDHNLIIEEMLPYFIELKDFNVNFFVDATPNYLGRDVLLLCGKFLLMSTLDNQFFDSLPKPIEGKLKHRENLPYRQNGGVVPVAYFFGV